MPRNIDEGSSFPLLLGRELVVPFLFESRLSRGFSSSSSNQAALGSSCVYLSELSSEEQCFTK